VQDYYYTSPGGLQDIWREVFCTTPDGRDEEDLLRLLRRKCTVRRVVVVKDKEENEQNEQKEKKEKKEKKQKKQKEVKEEEEEVAAPQDRAAYNRVLEQLGRIFQTSFKHADMYPYMGELKKLVAWVFENPDERRKTGQLLLCILFCPKPGSSVCRCVCPKRCVCVCVCVCVCLCVFVCVRA